MSEPDANNNTNNNQPSRMKQLLNGGADESQKESPMNRLPRGTGVQPPAKSASLPKLKVPLSVPAKPAKKKSGESGFSNQKFLPAFWTIASVMSFTVNIVLLIVLAIVWQNFSTIGVTLASLPEHLLGGLYNNFVLMDQAHIKTMIPVSKEIPVQFSLNVSGPTSVTLSQDVAIRGALVTVNTGGLNINNARANIVLPEGTVLPIYIQNLVVPVDQKVLAELNVAVDIPLNQTELHAPFVGLREVVEPFYCLLHPCP